MCIWPQGALSVLQPKDTHFPNFCPLGIEKKRVFLWEIWPLTFRIPPHLVYTLTKLPVAQRTKRLEPCLPEGSGSPSAGCSPDSLNQPFFPVPELVCQVLQHFSFGALTGRLRTCPVQLSSEDTEPPSRTCHLPPCRALPPRLPGFQGSSSSCPALFPAGAGACWASPLVTWRSY